MFNDIKLTRDISENYMLCLKAYETEREVRHDFSDWYSKALSKMEGSK